MLIPDLSKDWKVQVSTEIVGFSIPTYESH